MNRARTVVLPALCCLVAVAAQAQEWRGSASIALEVKGKPQGNVPDALVILRYQQIEPPGGPRPVVTGTAGQAVLVDLAEGVWEVEVSHADFLSFVALVMLESGRKPVVQASFLQASGSSLTPMRVKFMNAKGRAPSASVPLPPEAAARLAQRRPPQPLRAPARPTAEAPSRRRARAPRQVMPEPELRPLPETAQPADTPSPPPLAEPAPPPGDLAPPEPEVRVQPEPAPPLAEPQAQPPMPQTPARPEAAAGPTPTEPAPQARPEPTAPASDPAIEAEPEPGTAAPDPRPAIPEPEPATAAAPPAPAAPEADLEPAMPEPGPAPPELEPTRPPEPERLPPVPEPVSPPRPEPAPPAAEPAAPGIPAPPAPEPTPAELEPEPEAPMPQPEPGQPEPQPTPTIPPPAPGPTAVLPPPGPLGPTLRAYRDRTCVECRPGEWAISVEAIAGPASAPCSAALEADGRELAALLGGSVALELKEVAAPEPESLGQMGSGEATARAAELLRDDSRACRIVAAVIPKAGRFRGLRMEAADASGVGDCQADRPCPVGRARWLGQPRVSREPSANVIWGLFVNEAPDRARRARLTVDFAAPHRAWEPPS